MIKARGGLLCHARSARGALLRHQSCRQSFSRAPPLHTADPSSKNLLSSRGSRGFLSVCVRENNGAARRSLHGCSKVGLKHRGIIALWSFESRSPHFNQATLLATSRGLQTSSKSKLTTSDLIKSLQLGKGGGAKTSTSKNVLATADGCSVQGEKCELSQSNPVFEKPDDEGFSRDASTVQKPLSKFIPQHVVDMGFAKKESFSKRQNQGRSAASQVCERSLQRGSRQKLAVLNLESLRNIADKSSRTNAEADPAQEHQREFSNQQHASGKKGATARSAHHRSLVAAAFDVVPSIKEAGDSSSHGRGVSQGRQVAHHVGCGSADVPDGKHFIAENSRKQTQEFRESTFLTREGSHLVGKLNVESKEQLEVQFQPGKNGERITGGEQLMGGKLSDAHMKRTCTLPGGSSPIPPSQEESGGIHAAGESAIAKQRFIHVEQKGVTNKEHVLAPEEDTMRSQSYEETSVSTRENSVLFGRPFTVSNANTTWQHPERERGAVGPVLGGRNLGDTSEIVGKGASEIRLPITSMYSSEGVDFGSKHNTQLNLGESSEIVGKQASKIRLPTTSMHSSEGVNLGSKQDTQFVMRKVNAFNRWLSEDPEKDPSGAPRKPYDRNRTKHRKKNELKEKDLSVKPIPGEPHYEYLIRRKQVRAEAQKALKDDVDDYSHAGDDWVRKRLGWLCKEIPVLKASGLVKMLNNQRKWIKQEHLKELIEHLVRYMELNRAHRVLKWMQQQPFYEFEYELHNNMAFVLGRNDKLSRCQDVFDEIVRNGRFPDASVFTALIKAYLHKGDKGDINDAWKLYIQMLRLELTVSESLSEDLLKSLTCPTGLWVRQAEELLVKMKASGMYINEEMYGRVLDIYGKRGDHTKIDAVIDEMKRNHADLTLGILNSRLEACVKYGDTKRAEQTMEEIVELGFKPDWRSYAHLIQVYGRANMPRQSWEIFEKMKGVGLPVNFVTYHATIDAMATDGQHVEEVMKVLSEVEESGIKPLQPCYNSVMDMFLRLKKYDEVESIYNRGKAAKVRPAHAAYNMLMQAYVGSGQLDKAEALFQEMKITEGMGPNTRTYNILLEGYGTGCFKGRVREIFEEMSAKGCLLDPDVKVKVQSLISVKRIAELEKKRLVLTDEQREIIPGLLLGGAKMESPDRNRTYELHLDFNCENEVKKVIKDRLSFLFQAWWKPSQSTPLSQSTASSECKEALIGASAAKSFVRLETVSHGSFRFYAHQYRPNGEPVIPKLIHRWLKPRTLAYWYMYGGRKCQRTGGIILNASKYSGKQIQLVMKALKARTLDCRRKKRRNGDVIRFEGRSAMWLWKLMEPYILNAVKEQLKPEETPVDLALAKGMREWESKDQGSSDEGEATSDEDDWDELEEDESTMTLQILED